jgi:MFS family permease
MAAQRSGIYPSPGASSRSGVYRLEVAKTDVYDERRRTFLIQYPIGVVIGLGLAGVVAFALTGFLGYRDENEPGFTQAVFSQAWPLFLWFCALIMALQISILRHPTLRRQLTATLVVTLLSMAIVGILYYYKVQFLDFLQQLLQQLLNIRLLLPQKVALRHHQLWPDSHLLGRYGASVDSPCARPADSHIDRSVARRRPDRR